MEILEERWNGRGNFCICIPRSCTVLRCFYPGSTVLAITASSWVGAHHSRILLWFLRITDQQCPCGDLHTLSDSESPVKIVSDKPDILIV